MLYLFIESDLIQMSKFKETLIFIYLFIYFVFDSHRRGGEWFFKTSGSRKILVEFHGSRALVF